MTTYRPLLVADAMSALERRLFRVLDEHPRVPAAPVFWLVDPAHEARRARGRALRAVVWRLPHEVVMWAAIRLVAHGTTGAYSSQVVPELTVEQALRRWDDPRGGDRVYGQREEVR